MLLRSKGVRIALDDFGIGMSNLERLLEYPIDILKIDRSFVQSPTRESREGIMRGLVEMSKTMGFEIVAEGIETQGQLDLVRAAGITHAQGYFLANQRQLTIGSQKHCAGGLKNRHLRDNFDVDIFEGSNWP